MYSSGPTDTKMCVYAEKLITICVMSFIDFVYCMKFYMGLISMSICNIGKKPTQYT